MFSFSQGVSCPSSHLPVYSPPTPFSLHLLLLISEEHFGYNLLLLCLSGSLLAYNTTSHTDQSPRLSVKEGEPVFRIFFSTRHVNFHTVKMGLGTSGPCTNSLVPLSFFLTYETRSQSLSCWCHSLQNYDKVLK